MATTDDLVRVIFAAVGGNRPDEVRKHPARRTFQAIRIAINDELQQLQAALQTTQRLLKPQTGRLVILTYHSLEEDIVQSFKLATNGHNAAMANAERTLHATPDVATSSPPSSSLASSPKRSGDSWDSLLSEMVPAARPTFVFDDLVLTAAGKEQRLNPRARSARLFGATRTDANPINFMPHR